MNKRRFLIFVVAISVLHLLFFSAAASAGEITISAAISLKNAFEEIGKLYETKYKGTKVTFNFGASGALMRQIEGGAPVDVFASAAQKDMDEGEKKGLISPGTRVDFASNSVVLVTALHAGVPIKSFEDLTSPGIRKIAIGDPKTVPAGRYAEEVLAYFKILDTVRDKLIYTENVRQVLDYVARGEVDAGIVYSTDAMAGGNEVRIAAAAPEAAHKPVVYPIAVVKATRNKNAAEGFIMLVTSPEGKRILKKYGFKTVK